MLAVNFQKEPNNLRKSPNVPQKRLVKTTYLHVAMASLRKAKPVTMATPAQRSAPTEKQPARSVMARAAPPRAPLHFLATASPTRTMVKSAMMVIESITMIVIMHANPKPVAMAP